jgi:sugar phosphate isomerase/epimerase
MIFVSSSCIKSKFIKESVIALHNLGFINIELSGGTTFYNGMVEDLLELKEKYNLKFLCHNYFPPPQKDFVLNLSSLKPTVYQQSYQHIIDSLQLCEHIGAEKYAFHAGFFMDPDVSELGKRFKLADINDSTKAQNKFCSAYKDIISHKAQVKIYIENNVLSHSNYLTYNLNPFMLTNLADHNELKQKLEFNLLLDIAHLKVTCTTLKLNFTNEFRQLFRSTDYIHLSDNDGLHDLNHGIKDNSELANLLKEEDLKGKTFTLEIYDGPRSLVDSYQLLKKMI